MRSRLPFLLAAIFAAFHLIVVGGVILESAGSGGGEGFAFAILVYDFPLIVLCQWPPGTYLCYGVAHGSYSVLLISGTVLYGLVGFVIGIMIAGR